jgi:ABC-type dipeptide/oligopeptide/nickel transport system permease subunit
MTPTYVRLVRSSVLPVRQREFVTAARAVGASSIRIMRRHVLPNVLAPIIVMSTLNVSTAILVEGALSFLGIGVPPPTATWGTIVGNGRRYLQSAPWISSFGGIAITVTVLGLNLFGDGLRDALDPTIRRQPGA